ncbi:MAG: integrase core domain-containing protein, partial [Limisphaerales bacterium]
KSNWFEPLSRAPHNRPERTSEEIEQIVAFTRLCLYNQGVFCGAQAILWELEKQDVTPLPSLRTINRILSWNNLTHRRTGAYQPKGKRYPALQAQRTNQVHQADFVGPCYLQAPLRFYSLNTVDLTTGRCAIQPLLSKDSQSMIGGFWAIWTRLGLPEHLQVDNEVAFYGSPAHPRNMGALIRLCLHNDIGLWFIPPREPWRNGVVEKFNDHYRHKFLTHGQLGSEVTLRQQSSDFEQRHNQYYRYSKLRGRTPSQALQQQPTQLRYPPSPEAPRHPLPKPTKGQYHLVRFIRSDGKLDVFGEKFLLPDRAQYEYVRATVNVSQRQLQVHLGEELIEEINYEL